MLGTGALLALLLAPQGAPLPEGNAYVRSLVNRQRQREDALNRYTYDVLEAVEELDKDGIATKRETRKYEVFYVKGLPLRRQVEQNGRPLDAKAQAREDREVREKLDKISKGLVAREEVGMRISKILERYDFRALAREELDGRAALVFAFTALPGKRELDSDNVLRALAGRIWVDEADAAVARAELRNTAGIKFALGLGASLKSVEASMEFRRMEDGVWLPTRDQGTVAGRMFIFKGFRKRATTTYSNYRRFEVDSQEHYDTPVPH